MEQANLAKSNVFTVGVNIWAGCPSLLNGAFSIGNSERAYSSHTTSHYCFLFIFLVYSKNKNKKILKKYYFWKKMLLLPAPELIMDFIENTEEEALWGHG